MTVYVAFKWQPAEDSRVVHAGWGAEEIAFVGDNARQCFCVRRIMVVPNTHGLGRLGLLAAEALEHIQCVANGHGVR